jgi:hypothetical protein
LSVRAPAAAGSKRCETGLCNLRIFNGFIRIFQPNPLHATLAGAPQPGAGLYW